MNFQFKARFIRFFHLLFNTFKLKESHRAYTSGEYLKIPFIPTICIKTIEVKCTCGKVFYEGKENE